MLFIAWDVFDGMFNHLRVGKMLISLAFSFERDLSRPYN